LIETASSKGLNEEFESKSTAILPQAIKQTKAAVSISLGQISLIRCLKCNGREDFRDIFARFSAERMKRFHKSPKNEKCDEYLFRKRAFSGWRIMKKVTK